MSPVVRRGAWWLLAGAGLLALFCLALAVAAAPLPFESALLAWRGYDADLRDLMPAWDLRALRRAVWLLLALGAGAVALAAFLQIQAERWEPYRDRIFRLLVGMGSATTLFLVLWRAAFEAQWYPLQRVISDPRSLPIFGHRLLLVWPAQILQAWTHAGPRPVFFLVQAVAIAGTVFFAMRWSALFIGPALAWMGGPLLVLFLAPTFVYLTFFDVAVVFFHCLALWALHEGKWFWFVAAVTVGTLNHENVAILIPAAVAILWGRVPRRTAILVPGAALAGFLVVRVALHTLAPLGGLLEPHVWTNAVLLEQMRRATLESLAVLIFYFGVAAATLRDGDAFLRRAAYLVVPQLALIALIAGRFNEARNFEAFVPILIGLTLSTAQRQFRQSGAPIATIQ